MRYVCSKFAFLDCYYSATFGPISVIFAHCKSYVSLYNCSKFHKKHASCLGCVSKTWRNNNNTNNYNRLPLHFVLSTLIIAICMYMEGKWNASLFFTY